MLIFATSILILQENTVTWALPAINNGIKATVLPNPHIWNMRQTANVKMVSIAVYFIVLLIDSC